MVYRVWAAGRARDMASWIGAWAGPTNRGAEELALKLAVELESAETAGIDVAGAALDWNKTFDHIPLASARTVLERAGAPRWLAGPACS
eukprot:10141802-Lingulodinium_polyedra.AAC.1